MLSVLGARPLPPQQLRVVSPENCRSLRLHAAAGLRDSVVSRMVEGLMPFHISSEVLIEPACFRLYDM